MCRVRQPACPSNAADGVMEEMTVSRPGRFTVAEVKDREELIAAESNSLGREAGGASCGARGRPSFFGTSKGLLLGEPT